MGFRDRYFVLTADLDLEKYNGAPQDAGGATLSWLPVGTLETQDGGGAPFLGSFDGMGFSVKNFKYVPFQDLITDAMSGTPATVAFAYGLFGHLGDGSIVKNVNIPGVNWALSPTNTPLLGLRHLALSPLAAANRGGRIEACTVTNATVTLEVPASGASGVSSGIHLGGIVGQVAGDAAGQVELEHCLFTGALTSSTGGAWQSVGGLVGHALGATVEVSSSSMGGNLTVPSGVTTPGATAGIGAVGGLVGSSAALGLHISGSFSAGSITAGYRGGGLVGVQQGGTLELTDSFSTVALDAVIAGNDIASSVYIGGLLGYANGATALTRSYFAGSLLQPFLPSIAGELTQSPTLDTVVADIRMAPHRAYRSGTPFDVATTFAGWPSSGWTADTTTGGLATFGSTPALALAATENTALNTLATQLSDAATAKFLTLDGTLAFPGGDGTQHTAYRMQQQVEHTVPVLLKVIGGLTRSTEFKGSVTGSDTTVGGLYNPTTPIAVGGFTLPIVRKLILAVNQTPGNTTADTIADGPALQRFVVDINRAGGGYIGSTFAFPDGTIDVAGFPIISYLSSSSAYFYGILAGGANSVVQNVHYGKSGSWDHCGMLYGSVEATFRDFTFRSVTTQSNINTGGQQFGGVSGKVIQVTASNVAVEGFHSVTTSSGGIGYSGNTLSPLFGAASTRDSAFTNCRTTGLDISIETTGTNQSLRPRAGGILGAIDNASHTFTDCIVEGSIQFRHGSYTNNDHQSSGQVGGLIGQSGGNITATNCHVRGSFSGGSVGGFLGFSGSGGATSITNSTFSGTVSTAAGIAERLDQAANSGGMIGMIQGSGSSTFSGCSVYGTITSTTTAGGLVGRTDPKITIQNSYVSGVMEGVVNAGGLVGNMANSGGISGSTLSSNYFTGQVSAASNGGLVGYAQPNNQNNVIFKSLTKSLFDLTQVKGGTRAVGNWDLPDTAVATAGITAAALGGSGWTAESADHYPSRSYTGYGDLNSFNDLSTRTLLTPPGANLYEVAMGTAVAVNPPAHGLTTALEGNGTFSGTATEGYSPINLGTERLRATISALNGPEFVIPYTLGVKMFDIGDGTADFPFIIYNIAQLQLFRQYVDLGLSNDRYFRMAELTPGTTAADYTTAASIAALGPVTLDMTGEEWPTMAAVFSGYLEGNGSTVAHLAPKPSKVNGIWYNGFLYSLGAVSAVSDLNLTDLQLNWDGVPPAELTSGASGGLAAVATGGTVTDVTVSGIAQTDVDVYSGGLVGHAFQVAALTLTRVQTEVAFSDPLTGWTTNNRNSGVGGLIGGVARNNNYTHRLIIDQCATYGPMSGAKNMGGLVGVVIRTGIEVTANDSFSLSVITEASVDNANKEIAGGLFGALSNDNRFTMNRCYFAGEVNMDHFGTSLGSAAGDKWRLAGGLFGANFGSTTNVSFTNNRFTHDRNRFFLGDTELTTAWTEVTGSAINRDPRPDTSVSGYALSTAFSPQGVWEANVDGLFPRLAWQTADDDLIALHVAVCYTPAARASTSPDLLPYEGPAASNLYVRYPGATLSADAAALSDQTSPLTTDGKVLRQTYNSQMLVATRNGAEGDVTVPVTLTVGGRVRTLSVRPRVIGQGKADASPYSLYPHGMWANQDGQWTIYTADAVAGLSLNIQDYAAGDGYGIPCNTSTIAGPHVVTLGRNVDMSPFPQGISPIGIAHSAVSKPFTATFDGAGHTLSNVTISNDGYDVQATAQKYLGLFGYVQGGTVKNLALVNGTAAKSGIYAQGPYLVAAGGLVGRAEDATLSHCFSTLPVYGYVQASTLGTGGLVGQAVNTAITDCGVTGYAYTPAVDDAGTAAVGGLAGAIAGGSVTRSYAAGYVDGPVAGGLLGSTSGGTSVSGAFFDENATSGLPGVGNDGAAVSAAIGNAVPLAMNEDTTGGWHGDYMDQNGTFQSDVLDPNYYPLPWRFPLADTALKAGRIRLTLQPNAGSASTGSLAAAGAVILPYSSDRQPLEECKGDPRYTVAPDGKSFVKAADGLVQMELRQDADGSTRRVLMSVRCWYDNPVLVNPDTPEEHIQYTIRSSSELFELAHLTSGTATIDNVGHVHANLPDLDDTVAYDDFSDKVILLAEDIDLSLLPEGTVWPGIGSAYPFAGTLNGQGHSVYSLTAQRGLFSTLAPGALLENLMLANATVTASGAMTGLLVDLIDCTPAVGATPAVPAVVQNCGVSGVLTSASAGMVGGLAGENRGTVMGCFSTAEISGSGTLGGLVGNNNGPHGSLTDSYFTGILTGTGTVGGLAGANTGTVSQCYLAAYVSGVNVQVAAPGATQCKFDARLTALSSSTGTAGAEEAGIALDMTGNWTGNDGTFFPRIPALTDPLSPLADSALAHGGNVAAAIPALARYNRFNAVTIAAAQGELGLIVSPTGTLQITGDTAIPAGEANGTVRLYLQNGGSPAWGKNPYYLEIPDSLAVTYRFNFDTVITASGSKAYVDPNPSGWNADNTIFTIRTAADWARFLADASSGTQGLGKTYRLAANLDFGKSSLGTVSGTFQGTLDGAGHALSNFAGSAPLFQTIGAHGSVILLRLEKGALTHTVSAATDLAFLAKVNLGRMVNVAVEDCLLTVTQQAAAAMTRIGGLVVDNQGYMEACMLYRTPPASDADEKYHFRLSFPSGSSEEYFQVGGLAAVNSGAINGGCVIGDVFFLQGRLDSAYGVLAARNSGQIRYSYWQLATPTTSDVAATIMAYHNEDGSAVPANSLRYDPSNLALTARWLSMDSYGQAYHVENGRLKLYCFKLLKYDLTDFFGADPTGRSRYMFLGLQYQSGAEELFAGNLCSWQNYLLRNFGALNDTSQVVASLPIHSGQVSYTITAEYLPKSLADRSPIPTTSCVGTKGGSYTVNFNSASRILLTISLERASANSAPWGVYREDRALAAASATPTP